MEYHPGCAYPIYAIVDPAPIAETEWLRNPLDGLSNRYGQAPEGYMSADQLDERGRLWLENGSAYGLASEGKVVALCYDEQGRRLMESRRN